MPSIRYINQSAPFWDWVASMEDRVGEHPFFAGPPPPGAPGPSGTQFGPFGPFGPHGHYGHHGHFGAGRRHRDGRSDLPHRTRDEAQPSGAEDVNEKTADEDKEMADDAIPDPPEETPGNPDEECPGRRGHWGGRRRGGCGGRGGARHHGPRGWGHPYAFPHFQHMMGGGPGGPGPRGFGFLSELFGQQQTDNEATADDWKPEADVFDTEGSYVVHISLPGANKEDIGVNWDPEKSELTVAGVVHRPGDEAFLKTLALDERKVGAFERKVRLGTRSSPAQVDIDGITAKLENGILHVEVPKLNSDFVEIKKVDIE